MLCCEGCGRVAQLEDDAAAAVAVAAAAAGGPNCAALVVLVLIPNDEELELAVASPCKLSAAENMSVKRRCFVLGPHSEALGCSSWK
jgi:hypothetical protein